MSFSADFMEVEITINMRAVGREITDTAIIGAADTNIENDSMMSAEEHLQLARDSFGFCRSWRLCLVHRLVIAGSYREPFDTIASIYVQYI